LDIDIAKLLKYFFKNHEAHYSRILTGKFNESYFIKTGDEEFVLRIAPDGSTPILFYEKEMMKREPAVHSAILEQTDAPVPEIIQYDFSKSIIERNWLLMKRLPGSALSETGISGADHDKFFFKLGNIMRQVHGIKNDWFGYPEGSGTGPKEKIWFNAFKNMWDRLLDDILSTGIYSAKEKERLSSLLEKNKNVFDSSSVPALLHMDIWSQNLLCDSGGNLTGIVDWDRGLWGDPEIEFSVMEYCGTCPYVFWKGYGTMPKESAEYKIREIFYFLYEHQKYIFIRSLRSNNNMLARNYANECLNIAGSLDT
jgi:aminoglycoside phosphotransferase (APT) family kinase protein